MSTANPRRPTFGLSRAFERAVGTAVSTVQAIAFWTAALLPLALIVGVFAGMADQHLGVVGGAVAVNVLSAVVGHGHSPN